MNDDLQHYDAERMDPSERQRIDANEAERETIEAELNDLEAQETAQMWASQNGIGPEHTREQEHGHER